MLVKKISLFTCLFLLLNLSIALFSDNEVLFPLTVKDGLARIITIEEYPEKIISLSPANTEILFYIGAGDQVIGVTSYCDFPFEAKNREIIGGFSQNSISIEKIIVLKPDLIIADDTYQKQLIKSLEKNGYTVYSTNAQSLDEIYNSIKAIGRITGHPDTAEKHISYMKKIEKQITTMVNKIPENKRKKVFWEVWDNPLMTIGSNAFMGQIITKAGGINIFNEISVDYPTVNIEEIVIRNPDIIMVPDIHEGELNIKKITSRVGFSNIKAVKNKQIFILDGNITSRPGPRIINALGLVVKTLYPQQFKKLFGDEDPVTW